MNFIHIWHIPLHTASSQVSGVLSAQEKALADRIHHLPTQSRFLITKAATRHILSSYLQLAPEDICFEQTQTKKPFIAHAQNPHQIQFNITHSHEVALCAVTEKIPVGIDVEYKRPLLDKQRLVERFFHPEEVIAFKNTPKAQQEDLFFRLWTAKEALLKAIGCGIHGFTAETHMRINPLSQVQLCELPEPFGSTREWWFDDVPISAEYTSTYAIRSKAPVQPYFHDFHPPK